MDTQREQFQGHTVYSLSEIAMSLHRMIEQKYAHPYYIKAEILKLNHYPRSGHCYPELVEKENTSIKAEMRAVIWSAQYQYINDRFLKITGEPLKENINILCLATLEFSPVHGLALHIQDIEPTYTLGEMVKNRQQVINRLKTELVFTLNKSLPMALLPKRIAIISVITSKGYSDFINTLNTNPYGYHFDTELFSSILQGDKAVVGITDCLTQIESRRSEFDCVVMVRGGGGDVGLSCYDDYTLAHRVATFCLPVLTGIGHSTNRTITDLVAHEYYITPTDVAVSLIRKFQEFDEAVKMCQQRIVERARVLLEEQKLLLATMETNRSRLITRIVNQYRQTLNTVSQRLIVSSQQILMNHKQQNTSLAFAIRNIGTQLLQNSSQQLLVQIESLKSNYKHLTLNHEHILQNIEEKTNLLHPDNILKRGFSITRFHDKAVTKASQLKSGDKLVTQVFKGEIISIVQDKD